MNESVCMYPLEISSLSSPAGDAAATSYTGIKYLDFPASAFIRVYDTKRIRDEPCSKTLCVSK